MPCESENDQQKPLLRMLVLFSLSGTTAICGCSSIGPSTISGDRFDYVEAIASSTKEQMLLNIVKMRYVDSLTFLDVSSVVNQYSRQGGVSAGINWNLDARSTQNAGANTSFSDRPTISYAPRKGEEFTKSLMRPIPPAAIVSIAQAGWPVDFIFRVTMNSINGLQNRFGADSRRRKADPRFYEVLFLLREIQKSGATGIRVEQKDDLDGAVFFFTGHEDPEVEDKILRAKALMGLDPAVSEFTLTYGAVARSSAEIAILSRSLLEIITELGSYIEVPPKHVEIGRASKTIDKEQLPFGFPPLFAVKSGTIPKTNAFTSVHYRNHWYWIDDRDLPSKRTFAFLMLLSSLSESDTGIQAPLLTIPTG